MSNTEARCSLPSAVAIPVPSRHLSYQAGLTPDARHAVAAGTGLDHSLSG